MTRVSFNPIASWWLVGAFALAVTALTLWAYSQRLRGTSGRWRWIALALRLAAVILCFLAALRPSIVYEEKKKEPATLIFLSDSSSSMTVSDEVGGQRRWELERKALLDARAACKALGDDLTAKFYRFDSTLRDDPEAGGDEPSGRATALGGALLDALKREGSNRVSTLFLLSDGNNNGGPEPITAARQLKAQNVPVVTVAFGAENAGNMSKDLAVRDLITSPTVFVKNQLQVKGSLLVRGFGGQTLELEMLVEGEPGPVAVKRVQVPQGAEVFPVSGLSHVFKTPGEKRITLKVKPKEGELIPSNNELSTFVSVLKGGLNVLFLQGPHSAWEQKYWMRSVATSPDIQAEERLLRLPARRDGTGELRNEEFAPGRYDVYVLSDLPADFLTREQQLLLARAIDRGAGLIMLGGLSSFGPGGWGETDLSRKLPVVMSRDDGQLEPPEGVKFVPNNQGIDSYLLRVGSNALESQRIWNSLPAMPGINHLGALKPAATVFGQTPGPNAEPVMVGMDGVGRVLAFGGETWQWARSFSDEGIIAHRKFWRQVIFWLAHKEDQGENEVKIALDARRISLGQKLDFGVTARDAKGLPISDVRLETKVEQAEPAGTDPPYSEKLDVFNVGDEARGSFVASKVQPGDYRVTVVATREGKEVGRDSARFIVYDDDRELENPAADRRLLRQIADASGGESLAPEQLPKYLEAMKGKVFTESLSQTEREVWDNWPFLLVFATLLTLEWWLRKRHGWV